MFAGAACLVATIPGTASAQNPPGNNGTVKIDGEEFDVHPDNEPHVGCVFQVDFYGFDEGDLNAHVTFAVQPPTGPFVTILEDDVFIGEDDNSGGGSEAGLDAERTYDLTGLLDEFEQHPNQGWHIKLTVNAEGSQGADTKHKVFWVTGCETPPTTTTSTTEGPTTSTTEEETTSTTEEETTSTTEEVTTSTTEKPTTSTTEEETTSTTEEETTSTTEEETTSTTEEETTSTTEEETTSTTEEETTSTTEEETTSTTEEETTSTTEGSTTSSTEGSTTTVAPSSTSTTMAAPTGELPKTGGGSQGLLIAAGIIMLLGGGALLGSAKLSERRIA